MYALFGGILGAVFILTAVVAVAKEPALWFPAAVMGLILASYLSWLATTSLALTSDAIHYRSLFVTKDVRLSDIVDAEFVVGFSSFKPHQRLLITIRGTGVQNEITINLGLFDRTEIGSWMGTLNARLKSGDNT